jgi:hypothetical protein
MNTYLAVTRTIIMLGTITVGAMAWKVYGPPAEQLAPVVNRVVELANQTLGRGAVQPKPKSSEPPAPRLVAIRDSVLEPLPGGAPLRVDREVAPAAHFLDIPTHPTPQTVSTDALLGQLHLLGAVDVELKPWGATGQTYRCACRMASAANPTLERNFDAVATDAKSAVEQVLADIEDWRKQAPN